MYDEEQDAIESEVAQQERIVAEGVFEIRPANGGVLVPVEEGLEEVNPLDIPDHYDLPMHGSITACPKCNSQKMKVEYHPHGVLAEPCGARFGWPNVQNLGEHLCITCARCKYGWPEQVAHGAA